MGKPEAQIEDYLVTRCKLVNAEVRKVQWIGRRGAPDRFVMPEGANTYNFWAEVKRPGGKLDDHQEREIATMRERGEIVHVFDSREQIDKALPLPRSRT
jgi:hypothetical protein